MNWKIIVSKTLRLLVEDRLKASDGKHVPTTELPIQAFASESEAFEALVGVNPLHTRGLLGIGVGVGRLTCDWTKLGVLKQNA